VSHSQPKSINQAYNIYYSYPLFWSVHPGNASFQKKSITLLTSLTPTLKSFLVFLTEENPQRSQTSTIADTDNIFTYVGQK